MTKDQRKDLLEMVGFASVIASLVFLTFEVRQNTVAVNSQTHQAIQDQITDIYNLQLEDRVLSAIEKGVEDPESLTNHELEIFVGFLDASMQAYQNLYYQVRSGTYDPDLAEGWWQELRNSFEAEGLQRYWDARSYIYSSDFRDHVENNVLLRKPNPPYSTYFRSGKGTVSN